jgi:hypothetical protein
MKHRILLFLAAISVVSIVHAQKKVTAYAITGIQKGQSNWTEVRLVDVVTGEEIQSVYQSAKEVEILNARTGKPVVKKDLVSNRILVPTITESKISSADVLQRKKELETYLTTTDRKRENTKDNTNVNTNVNTNINTDVNIVTTTNVNSKTRVVIIRDVRPVQSDKPFATSSAACALDEKHGRLYYTPMNINQLRYIDLKTGKIYYFEDEPFGALKGRGDVPNQITRMVLGSDGNGYALTNDANHLIQFTTGKKPVITDLGALNDDAANAASSVHSQSRFGGDMIADANKNLYLIGADHTVFKISLETKTATFLGKIKGLPSGFSTNGAIAEGGSSVIVTSSTNTIGYYRFDLNTLEAEKVSTGASVFNSSDLANSTLAFAKEKKKKEKKEIKERKQPDLQQDVVVDKVENNPEVPTVMSKKLPDLQGNISIYPNPVVDGTVRLSFADQPQGKYSVEVLDISGKLISKKDININNKVQVEELRLPEKIARGNYLVKVTSDATKASSTTKLVVQ